MLATAVYVPAVPAAPLPPDPDIILNGVFVEVNAPVVPIVEPLTPVSVMVTFSANVKVSSSPVDIGTFIITEPIEVNVNVVPPATCCAIGVLNVTLTVGPTKVNVLDAADAATVKF